jgi:L-gulonate 3-dehydrogenase
LAEAVKGATYIQECTPENLEMKTKLFQELEKALKQVGNTTVCIGSSTSTLMPSQFIANLGIKDRFLVAHPVKMT